MSDPASEVTVAAAELRQLVERVERLEEEKATIQNDIKEVMAEAKGRVDEKRQAFKTEAQQLLNQVQVEASGLEEDIAAGVDRAVRTDVRSPVRGTVKQVLKNTIGGVVRPDRVLRAKGRGA